MPDDPQKQTVSLSGGAWVAVIGLLGTIATGLGGTMKWIASDVAAPVTTRLVKNYDFQEENAKANTKAIEGLSDKFDTFIENQKVTISNQVQSRDVAEKQLEAAKKAATVLETAVPVKPVERPQ